MFIGQNGLPTLAKDHKIIYETSLAVSALSEWSERLSSQLFRNQEVPMDSIVALFSPRRRRQFNGVHGNRNRGIAVQNFDSVKVYFR